MAKPNVAIGAPIASDRQVGTENTRKAMPAAKPSGTRHRCNVAWAPLADSTRTVVMKHSNLPRSESFDDALPHDLRWNRHARRMTTLSTVAIDAAFEIPTFYN